MPRLKVFLAGASDLKKADITGSSDPYVKLQVVPPGPKDKKAQKTKVRKRSLNPKWGDVFYFDVLVAKDSRLELKVLDWDRFTKDDPLGDASVDLSTVPPNVDYPLDLPLDTQGSIKLELHLEDENAPGGSAAGAAMPAYNLAPAPTAVMGPPTGQEFQPIITQDPFGVVYFGQPVTPAPAYPGQSMPPPYLFTPPPAYYGPPPAALPQYEQYNFAPVDVAPPPPPFYYGAPPAYEPPPYSPVPPTDWTPMVVPPQFDQFAVEAAPVAVPPAMDAGASAAPADALPPGMADAQAAADVDDGSALPPHMQFAPNTDYKPVDETVADFSDDDFKTTNQRFGGDYFKVSHLNFFSNYLERIEGLANYPNMMRLTLRENNLKDLNGIGEAPYLRWIDVSNNYLEDFRGMGVMMNLEWLDAHNNNIDNFGGLDWAPNLTYINLHANHMTNLMGADKFQNLRWLDLSESDIRSARGLETCFGLQEINLAANYLEDVDSIKALANLPHLFRLNIYYNNFSKKQVTDIVNHFYQTKPQCEVITTKAQAKAAGHNVRWKGNK